VIEREDSASDNMSEPSPGLAASRVSRSRRTLERGGGELTVPADTDLVRRQGQFDQVFYNKELELAEFALDFKQALLVLGPSIILLCLSNKLSTQYWDELPIEGNHLEYR
jgi:hypothetical protein